MDNAQAKDSLTDNRPRRRMVPVVDARFQWKYTLLIMALGVGLTAIMGGLIYDAHIDNTRLLDLANPQVQSEVVRGDQIILLYLIALVVVMGVGLGFWGLIVTHRIAGPLYIVARYLSVLAGGRYPDMRPLRKRDELHEFFSAFEEAVNAMRNRDMMTLREIDGLLSEAKKGGGAADQVGKVLQRYRDQLADSLGETGGVKVDGD